jgi:hypothetical protein
MSHHNSIVAFLQTLDMTPYLSGPNGDFETKSYRTSVDKMRAARHDSASMPLGKI